MTALSVRVRSDMTYTGRSFVRVVTLSFLFLSMQCIAATIPPVATDDTLDFGDAPTSYRTYLGHDGARHVLTTGILLGTVIDAESDSWESSDALGDDNQDLDDEDGVTFVDGERVVAGWINNVEVVASTNGYLNAWIDYDRDGTWSNSNEQIFSDQPLTPGTNALEFDAPGVVSHGTSFARFRFSSETNLSFTGHAPDGEVEDYSVMLDDNLDFGDAPESYGTFFEDDGARHRRIAGYFLGAAIDVETDGWTSANAEGDDTQNVNDEDGVLLGDDPTLYVGDIKQIGVVASTSGYLNAWIDYDRDGTWSNANEQIFSDQPLAQGTNILEFAVPVEAGYGVSFARFRFSSRTNLLFTGLAIDGEVEDYAVTLDQNMDFGDAPASYGTFLVDDGARHRRIAGYSLGATTDVEDDAWEDTDADGDDSVGLDDEDGVIFENGAWVGAGTTKQIDAIASTGGYLNAWIDYDRDGTWSNANEHVLQNTLLVPGTNSLAIAVPLIPAGGSSFARFRFSSRTNLLWTGLAPDGEVEDYKLTLMPSQQPEITSVSADENGAVTLAWTAVGSFYVVETTTNLTPSAWQPAIGTTWPIDTNVWTEPETPSNNRTFYRIVLD